MAEYKIDIEKSAQNILDRVQLMDLVQAYQDGRCVVLPFPLHRMLLNTSDPYNPELMKDFRISATWTHCGRIFEFLQPGRTAVLYFIARGISSCKTSKRAISD